MATESWQHRPAKHDFVSAESYLSLLVGEKAAARLVKRLSSKAGVTEFAAKDILRAARLELLPESDSEVAKDLEKVQRGEKLSPVLLVTGNPLWIADGYHRVCASYHLDEKTAIPCRIVTRSD